MSFSKLVAAVAVCLLVESAGRADDAMRFENERSIDSVRQPPELLPEEPAAFVEVSDLDSLQQSSHMESPFPGHPYLDQPYGDRFSAAESQMDEPNFEPSTGCGDICGCGEECQCGAINYRSGWTLGFDASALQSHMATRYAEAWPDEVGAAGRISLGYEWDNGFGLRTQAWGYSFKEAVFYNYPFPLYFYYYSYDDIGPYYGQSATLTRDIELTAGTVYLDFYKAILSRSGELLLGAGPAFGHLEFISPPVGDRSKYYGGGVSVFGQGFYPFYRRNRWELALTGQARVALLTGQWDFEYASDWSEHSNSMSILELGIGPEIRRRFGRFADHYWFVRTLAEFQQWRSDRMGPLAGDTLALQGATINFGVAW